MSPLKNIIALSFFLGSGSMALSDDLAACARRAADNPVQSNMCYQKALAGEDARLNKAYVELKRQLPPRKFASLKEGEHRWLVERDYKCKMDAITIDLACLLTETSKRADELESLLRF
ncbi:lysozyme inhibitor LprI family protein [uncultured Rhodoblastus sp.]|uniref:lysozyme inhibitor LprI family protein n=1 Tax=uncultured Rhodoblastus sp. TaxID=543037 RepID=UPI0025E4EBC1|nr:lysozyme inhibitor LprI family protein [uncultured Rhodoblastus sp.]